LREITGIEGVFLKSRAKGSVDNLDELLVLKQTGRRYLHYDPTASHFLKLVLAISSDLRISAMRLSSRDFELDAMDILSCFFLGDNVSKL
jgi:hypothetical protein